MLFPSVAAFSAQINGLEVFMTCVKEGEKQGQLEFNPAAEVPSLSSRFVVEQVANSNDLVHIRSCCQNKYLCRATHGDNFLVATGDKPITDEHAADCTVFRVKDMGSQVVTFTHVQSGLKVMKDGMHQYIVIGPEALHILVVSYGELVRLPKRVIFKGDNGKYLKCQTDFITISNFLAPATLLSDHKFNEFVSGDGKEQEAHYEIAHHNGVIRVKSLANNMFWKRHHYSREYNDCWIWCDSEDTTVNNRNTLFKVQKLGDNKIALTNLGNDKVCKRMTTLNLRNCLAAEATNFEEHSHLVVEEPLTYRSIEFKYNLDDAKIITTKEFVQESSLSETNHQKEGVVELRKAYIFKKMRDVKWEKSTTITTTFHVEINIPLPEYNDVEGKIDFSHENVTEEHLEKGSTDIQEIKVEAQTEVPPMHKGTIKGYVHKVEYEIPCSYIMTNVYTNGDKTTVIEEGVCQGFEQYHFQFETYTEPL